MNKRIKNKIIKSVSTKLKAGKSLTGFEEAYFNKHLYEFVSINCIYADNVKVHPFQNLIDAMESIESLRYSLENKEANHVLFNSDETGTILSAGHGKMPKEEPEMFSKHIAGLDDEAYEDENSKWLGGIDVGVEGKELSIVDQAYLNKHSKQFQHSFSNISDERINAGLINAETIDVSNFNFSAPESYHEIQSSVKETKWQKAKGKLKGWFGK